MIERIDPKDGLIFPGRKMRRAFRLHVSKGAFTLHASVQPLGADLLVCIWGGPRPHLGAVGMATPRRSLKDPSRWSATSSNFTFVGHKEDEVVKKVSERLAARLKAHVVVTAGIHWDAITPEGIDIVANLIEKLSGRILERLKGRRR